jgi:hypothetical protein
MGFFAFLLGSYFIIHIFMVFGMIMGLTCFDFVLLKANVFIYYYLLNVDHFCLIYYFKVFYFFKLISNLDFLKYSISKYDFILCYIFCREAKIIIDFGNFNNYYLIHKHHSLFCSYSSNVSYLCQVVLNRLSKTYPFVYST